jgi:hypothetical protein
VSATRYTTTVAEKLGLKADQTVLFLGAPETLPAVLGELPDGVRVRKRLGRGIDLLIFFTTRRAELEQRIEALREAVRPDGMAWIAWPKRASGVATDVNENVVRDVALPTGLVDTKVCAIDETWSGLRLVIRKELR